MPSGKAASVPAPPSRAELAPSLDLQGIVREQEAARLSPPAMVCFLLRHAP